ncbi:MULTISPECIES: hypothetical protein [Sphingobium]|uniref:hypothetical protein n=1 Tax=Sphingobium TaxID=165695 RepID=UPI000C08D1E2|nr:MULTISPECIES: hypothetical protein [Sphingobium]PHP17504.1 hypothetical protein CG471_22580 [Sphingobium sp. IP1]
MLHQHLQPAGAMPAGLTSLALPAEIRAAIKAGAWIVFNVSGGKDSSAAMFAVSIVLDGLGHPRSRNAVGSTIPRLSNCLHAAHSGRLDGQELAQRHQAQL